MLLLRILGDERGKFMLSHPVCARKDQGHALLAGREPMFHEQGQVNRDRGRHPALARATAKQWAGVKRFEIELRNGIVIGGAGC
jgi:hypothetical protein